MGAAESFGDIGDVQSLNVEIIEYYQSKTLRMIANAPWYESNKCLQTIGGLPTLGTPFHFIFNLPLRFQVKWPWKLFVTPLYQQILYKPQSVIAPLTCLSIFIATMVSSSYVWFPVKALVISRIISGYFLGFGVFLEFTFFFSPFTVIRRP